LGLIVGLTVDMSFSPEAMARSSRKNRKPAEDLPKKKGRPAKSHQAEPIQGLVDSKQKVVAVSSDLALSDKQMGADLTGRSFAGLGSAGSRVYFQEEPLVIGVDAEVLAYQSDAEEETRKLLPLSFSPMIGYRLTNNLIFNSRFNLASGGVSPHAGGSDQLGSATVTYAYLDYLFHDLINLRMGHQMVPIGLLNPLAESHYYLSVSRPELETQLIPGPWHETGLQIWGQRGHIRYSIGAWNSIDASQLEAGTFLSEGKQNGDTHKAQDMMLSSRLDFTGDTLQAGLSYLVGDTAQDSSQLDRVRFNLADFHFRLKTSAILLQGVYALGHLDESHTLQGNHAEEAQGYYLTLALDILAVTGWSSSSEASLPLFVRHSEYDLNKKLSISGQQNDNLNRTRTTVGINFRPKKGVAFKTNYQLRSSKAQKEKEGDLFELGLSVAF
jgi:hypothetical protein